MQLISSPSGSRLHCSAPRLGSRHGRSSQLRSNSLRFSNAFRSASELLQGFGRQGNAKLHIVTDDSKRYPGPPVQQAVRPGALSSVDGSSLVDTIVSGSLHAVMMGLWIGALALTMTTAVRFATLPHAAASSARTVGVAARSPVLTRAFAAIVGGVLQLLSRALASNAGMCRLACLGMLTFVMNSVTMA